MSGGRVELGIGSGWFEAEHRAYGIPFPDLGERFDRYEEQVAIIAGLWGTPEGETYSFAGKHYQLTDSPALPKPAQSPRPPILIGGGGAKRTPRLAAKFADEFNIPFAPIDKAKEIFAGVDAACEAIGRDPSTMIRSVAQPVVVGRDDAEVARRAANIGRDVAELKENAFAGTPAEVLDRIGAWHEATGVRRVYLQLLDLSDLDHVDLFAAEVASQWTS
jgi:alkanesulfonate monooxygenase